MHKKRILIVEDNSDTVEVYSYALRFYGYDTITARNGIDAVNLSRSEIPDLIIMDVMLPKMDGLEATTQIRKEPKTRFIPIMAVTAMARPSDREECLRAGCDAYLVKPFTYKDLANAIDKLLQKTVGDTCRVQGQAALGSARGASHCGMT